MRNKWNEVYLFLKWKINSGIYLSTDKLPSENELAIKFDCSRLTARKALHELIDQKMIIVRQGRGYFVSMGQQKMTYEPLTGYKGEKIQFHLINEKIDDEQAQIFLDLDSELKDKWDSFQFSFIKTQYDNLNKPYTVLHSFLNTSILGVNIEPNQLRNSLSAYLTQNNIIIKKRIEKVLVHIPNIAVSLKLRTHQNTPVVASYSLMYDLDNRLIEYAIRYTKLNEYNEIFVKEY